MLSITYLIIFNYYNKFYIYAIPSYRSYIISKILSSLVASLGDIVEMSLSVENTNILYRKLS